MKKILVYTILLYFRFWARIALATHRPKVIGIAGSVGKSSTKQVLLAALTPFGKVLATSGNSETGLPLSILGVKVDGYRSVDWLRYMWQAPFGVFNLVGIDYLIAEMGIDSPQSPKNMGYLLTIVEPDVAVIVQESAAHTEEFERALTADEKTTLSDEQRLERLVQLIIQEDLKMVGTKRCAMIIYNADNVALAREVSVIRSAAREKKIYTFGADKHHDAYYLNAHVSLDETRFDQMILGAPVTVKYGKAVLPMEYQEVTAAALLTCAALGLNANQAGSAIENYFDLPKGRASVFKGINGSIILDSSYNASRESVMAFLDLALQLKQKTGRPVVFAFGDMRELGAEARFEHEIVARRIIEVVDQLFLIGEMTKKYVLPIVEKKIENVRWFKTASDLGIFLKDIPEQSIVLAKGSQNTIFLEEAIKQILADPRDQVKLCRQEKHWKFTKQRLGLWHEVK